MCGPCRASQRILFLFFSCLTSFVRGQSLDNFGSEFLVGFLPNYDSTNFLELQVTAPIPANILIEYPVGNVIDSAIVVPGEITIFSIPNPASEGWPEGTVASNLIRATSLDGIDFAMYLVNDRALEGASRFLLINTWELMEPESNHIVTNQNRLSAT